jgi:hypothetical protein
MGQDADVEDVLHGVLQLGQLVSQVRRLDMMMK